MNWCNPGNSPIFWEKAFLDIDRLKTWFNEGAKIGIPSLRKKLEILCTTKPLDVLNLFASLSRCSE